MPTLGDFLGGTQTTQAGPQPGANDPGFQERKQGWMQALKEMAQDPVNAMTMVQIGTALANPQRGASTAGIITNAINQGMQYRGRYQQMQDEAELQRQKQAREQQRVDLEERRAGISEKEMEMRQAVSEEDRKLARERLGLERERLGIDRMRASREGRGGGGSTSELERITARFEAMGLPYEVSLRKARNISSAKSEEEMVQKYFDTLYDAALSSSYPGDPPPDRKALLNEAREMVMGKEEPPQYAPNAEWRIGPEDGNATWKGLSEDKKLEAIRRVQDGEVPRETFDRIFMK